MIEGNFVYLPALVVAAVLVLLGLRARWSPWTVLIALGAVVHTAGVVAVTLFPFPVQREVIEEGRELQVATNNFVPLVHILEAGARARYASVLHQAFGNLVMLAPLGLYAPLLWHRFRTWRTVLALGVGVSLGIEGVQFMISTILGFTYKIADVDDVIVNTIGVMGAYLGYRLLAGVWPDIASLNEWKPAASDDGSAKSL